MKLFILASGLMASLSLLLIDLKIKNNHVVRQKIQIEAEISALRERKDRIAAEVRMELADPEIEVYIVSHLEYERSFERTKEMAKQFKQGRTDTRRVNNEDQGVSRP